VSIRASDYAQRPTSRATIVAMKVPPGVRAYLAKIGAKGGKHSSGAGGRAVWADVSAEERSERMRELVRRRWKKAKGKRRSKSA